MAVIFTGTYPTLNGMHDFAANKLGLTQPTLASILKEHGYTTGAVIGSAVLDSRFGLNRGFDFYYDNFDFNRLQESNLDQMERPGNVVGDVTLDWLSQNYQKKFFLWMHLYDPHFPYRPPTPYTNEYRDHPYDGEIAFADAQVGRLIHFLKMKDLYKNTLIVLTSNLGGEILAAQGEGEESDAVRDQVMEIVRSAFRPEFLNRLDEILLFRKLSRQQMKGIVDIQIERLQTMLMERKITLDVDESARAWLASSSPTWFRGP